MQRKTAGWTITAAGAGALGSICSCDCFKTVLLMYAEVSAWYDAAVVCTACCYSCWELHPQLSTLAGATFRSGSGSKQPCKV